MNPISPSLVFASPSRLLQDRSSVPKTPVEITPVPAVPCISVLLGQNYNVERIFLEFSSRRAALIRAITIDEEEFFRKCDSSLESMCLYGHMNGSWEVRVSELLPQPSLPEPTGGINLFRDNMEHLQWLEEVAKRCDSWLISVSFFVGGTILNANGRWSLFNYINSLETVHEAFLESDTYRRLRREEEERSRAVDGDEEDDNKDGFFCDVCGDPYHSNGFWICCDLCAGWSHGRCVKVTREQSERMKHFVCPECMSERRGHDSESE